MEVGNIYYIYFLDILLIYMCLYVCVCTCIQLYVYIVLHMCVYVCVYIYICVYILLQVGEKENSRNKILYCLNLRFVGFFL